VKRQAIFLARWAGRGAFKATALVLAFVIIVALWFWNASLSIKGIAEIGSDGGRADSGLLP
jgi:hypothetical protein